MAKNYKVVDMQIKQNVVDNSYVCFCGNISLPAAHIEGRGRSLIEVEQDTDFRAIMTHSGRVHYICQECYRRCQDAANVIKSCVPDQFLYFESFFRE